MSEHPERILVPKGPTLSVVNTSIVLARRPDGAEDIWSVLLGIAAGLDPTAWCLIGGQMVAFRASIAGALAPRTSDDLDILSNVYLHPDAVSQCARMVRDLGFQVEELHESGHRFTKGRLIIDVLAPDHLPKNVAVRTVSGRSTIEVPGGTQALHRAELVPVEYGERKAHIPIPNLLGALLLKADATRLYDPARHLLDVAFLTSLVDDPLAVRRDLKGSDSRRLRTADRYLKDEDHRAWRALGVERQRAAYATWRLLLDGL